MQAGVHGLSQLRQLAHDPASLHEGGTALNPCPSVRDVFGAALHLLQQLP
jgi:hypothetical protein